MNITIDMNPGPDACSVLDQMPYAVVACDTDLRITTWSHGAELLYGWPARRAIGREVGEVLCTELSDAERDVSLVQAMRDGVWSGEVVQRRRDGSRIRIASRVAPTYDQSGAWTGLVAANRRIEDTQD